MNNSKSASASASGTGTVIRKADKDTAIKAGGTITGQGTITRANGEVVHFVLTSDPLTQEQADLLNSEE